MKARVFLVSAVSSVYCRKICKLYHFGCLLMTIKTKQQVNSNWTGKFPQLPQARLSVRSCIVYNNISLPVLSRSSFLKKTFGFDSSRAGRSCQAVRWSTKLGCIAKENSLNSLCLASNVCFRESRVGLARSSLKGAGKLAIENPGGQTGAVYWRTSVRPERQRIF